MCAGAGQAGHAGQDGCRERVRQNPDDVRRSSEEMPICKDDVSGGNADGEDARVMPGAERLVAALLESVAEAAREVAAANAEAAAAREEAARAREDHQPSEVARILPWKILDSPVRGEGRPRDDETSGLDWSHLAGLASGVRGVAREGAGRAA